jgi:hypothetical protein
MIRELENEIRNRIGKWIYGADQETLEDAAMQVLVNNHGNYPLLKLDYMVNWQVAFHK